MGVVCVCGGWGGGGRGGGGLRGMDRVPEFSCRPTNCFY